MAGKNSFFFNGPNVDGGCERLLPIMIFNKDRVGNGGHIWGRRSEATILFRVHGFWPYGDHKSTPLDASSPIGRWYSFTSPNIARPTGNPPIFFSSCGDIHVPPNIEPDSNGGYPSYLYTSIQNHLQYETTLRIIRIL